MDKKYISLILKIFKNGFGVERWLNGEIFEGIYIDGVKEGKGEFQWSNGAKYIG